jgi:DNA-directed RNA polymerase subunit beta'
MTSGPDGAEAIRELLSQINCEELSAELRAELKDASGQKKAKIVKRLEVCGSFSAFGQQARMDDN